MALGPESLITELLDYWSLGVWRLGAALATRDFTTRDFAARDFTTGLPGPQAPLGLPDSSNSVIQDLPPPRTPKTPGP